MLDWPRGSLRSDSTVCFVLLSGIDPLLFEVMKDPLCQFFFVDVPVVGLLDLQESGIRLEGCFRFPLL